MGSPPMRHIFMSLIYDVVFLPAILCTWQVDALRHQVASLEGDLKSSTTANSQLQRQLSEVRSSLTSNTRQLTEERDNLQLQVRVKVTVNWKLLK